MRGLNVGYLIIIALSVLVVGLGWLLILNYQETQQLEALIQKVNTPPETPEITPSNDTPAINPHTVEIKRIEAESGVFLSRISKLIISEEGDRKRPYLDPSGHVTIGIGRNLEGHGISVSELHAIANEIDYKLLMQRSHIQDGRVYIRSIDLANKVFSQPLSEHDVQLLLTDDLRNVVAEAKKVFPNTWQGLDPVRKEAIVDLMYNLGLPHFKEFVKFIGAVKGSDWDTAASELLLSDAARENILRYHRNATVIQTGDAKYFGL